MNLNNKFSHINLVGNSKTANEFPIISHPQEATFFVMPHYHAFNYNLIFSTNPHFNNDSNF